VRLRRPAGLWRLSRRIPPRGFVLWWPSPALVREVRCEHSGNKPFCDGTHLTIGFDVTVANW